MESDYTFIDLTYLNEITDNSDDIKRELIDIFISQIPEFEDDFNSSVQSKNWKFLAQVAHKAKSSVMSMGMEELGKIDLKNIELLANKFYIDELTLKVSKTEKESRELETLKATFQSYPVERIKWLDDNYSEQVIVDLISKFTVKSNGAIVELKKERNKLIY